MITNFYINNTLVNPPVNYKELQIELKFREAIVNGSSILSTTPNNKWRFQGVEAQAINSLISQGFIFEGIPFRIELYHNNTTELLFDGFIDCTDDFYTSCGEVFVTTKSKQGIDWLSDVADGISYERMYQMDSEWFVQRFIYPPAVINDVPQGFNAFSALITCIVTVIQLIDMVITFCRTIADFSGELWWAVILKLLLQIAYMIVLTQVVIAQMQHFILYLIQPVKYLCGMRYIDLLKAGANALQIDSVSAPAFENGFFKDVVRISEALNPPNTNTFITDMTEGQENKVLKWLLKPTVLGIPNIATQANIFGYTEPHVDQRGFYNGTFGALLSEMKQLINGKIVMDNSTLTIVRRDKLTTAALYTVPDLRQDFHGYNTEDFYANIYITFQSDTNEKNTIDQYLGTAYSVNHELKIVNDPKLVLMKGLKEIRLPIALTKRKTELTVPEQVAKVLIPFVEKILNHMVDFVNFHIGATWNFWVDIWEWIKNLFEEIVQWLVDLIEDVINIFIDALNVVLDGINAIVNTIIDVANFLSGGSIGHIDLSIGYVDFGPVGEQIVTFIVSIALAGVAAPIFGLLMSDPHTLIIMLMELLGMEVPVIEYLNKFEIEGFDEDRMGMILIENDFMYVPKIVKLKNITPNGSLASKKVLSRYIRVADDNDTVVTAKTLWNNGYFLESFARVIDPTTGGTRHNQYFKWKMDAPFCFADYQKVKNDNIITDQFGTFAELDSLLWNVYDQEAVIEYRVNKEYNITNNGENNFKLNLYEPNGETI